MNKKRGIQLTTFVLFLIFMWTQGFGPIRHYGVGDTPISSIYFGQDNDLPVWKLRKVVGQADLDTEKKIVFYENVEGSIMLSIVERKWNGKWRMVGTGGGVSLQNSQPVSTASLTVDDGPFGDRIDVKWGGIYDPKVSTVKLDREEASIINGEGKIRVV